MSVVHIRGTSGSGKTYIAEQVITRLGGLQRAVTTTLGPRNKVGGYIWPSPPVTIVGRYTAACGGVDTLSWRGAADDVEKLILAQVAQGQSALLEGLATYGKDRFLHLSKVTDLTVIHLDASLLDCVAAINQRRAARGVMEPVDEVATRRKYKAILTTNRTNRELGIKVETHRRETALPRVMELLGL